MVPGIRVFVAIALWAAAPAGAQELVLTFGGDVNFARSGQTPLPDRVRKFGTHTLAETTRELKEEWDGDINFVNAETVVADTDGAQQWGKAFTFRSHPENFRHLIALGVNAFSLANNHAFDHGRPAVTVRITRLRSLPPLSLQMEFLSCTKSHVARHSVLRLGSY